MKLGEETQMKTLILGAGVIGSFNAAGLAEAGQDVTLRARGRRLAELREHPPQTSHWWLGSDPKMLTIWPS